MVMDRKMETTVLQIFPGKKKTGSLHGRAVEICSTEKVK